MSGVAEKGKKIVRKLRSQQAQSAAVGVCISCVPACLWSQSFTSFFATSSASSTDEYIDPRSCASASLLLGRAEADQACLCLLNGIWLESWGHTESIESTHIVDMVRIADDRGDKVVLSAALERKRYMCGHIPQRSEGLEQRHWRGQREARRKNQNASTNPGLDRL